ncbi:ferritin-like domain-containing protein [Mumia sp. ZJ430]|uniref:ferritin-like domain-containing protein n=1 Tax=Mumia sp. ZJ430 TaxID=2708083 RepID=UPI00141FAFB7|nr:ferritin-like domain-containing protein [Mumia sp. ZJ430]
MRRDGDHGAGVETDPTDAWQNALAGEHAAVYAYGLIAGRLAEGSAVQRQAASAFALHRKRRDDVMARLVRDGQTPVEAQPAYETGAVDNAAGARRVAQAVEAGLCRSWLVVVGVTTGAARTYAATALTESATTLLAWGGQPSALPGVS